MTNSHISCFLRGVLFRREMWIHSRQSLRWSLILGIWTLWSVIIEIIGGRSLARLPLCTGVNGMQRPPQTFINSIRRGKTLRMSHFWDYRELIFVQQLIDNWFTCPFNTQHELLRVCVHKSGTRNWICGELADVQRQHIDRAYSQNTRRIWANWSVCIHNLCAPSIYLGRCLRLYLTAYWFAHFRAESTHTHTP